MSDDAAMVDAAFEAVEQIRAMIMKSALRKADTLVIIQAFSILLAETITASTPDKRNAVGMAGVIARHIQDQVASADEEVVGHA